MKLGAGGGRGEDEEEEEEEEEAATRVDESTIEKGFLCGKSSISLATRPKPCAAREEEEEEDEEEEEVEDGEEDGTRLRSSMSSRSPSLS